MRHDVRMDSDRQRLGAAVLRRRVDLGYTSRRALADVAGIGKRTVDAIETGNAVRAATRHKLERVLRWEPGSMDAILAGGGEATLAGGGEATEAPPPTSSHGKPDLRDEMEQTLWNITELSEDERCFYIYQRRVRSRHERGA